MEPITSESKERSNRIGWIFVIAMAVVFILWGLFIFFTVGDKGPPSWDFGVIKDIPGESSYSTERH
jgi:flagellar basal body-associated protein FliL